MRCFNFKRSFFFWLLLAATASVVRAQNLVANPTFEGSRDHPDGWRVVGADGRRVTTAPGGRRALMLRGNGDDQGYWRAEGVALKSGTLYRLSFSARAGAEAGGGVLTAGTSRVNRDFVPTGDWQRHGFVFSTPSDATNDFVRLGQWHVNGGASFADPELLPVVPVHRRFTNDVELGEGETVQGGIYRFEPAFGWLGGNYHRPLFLNHAGFNTDRWVLSNGSEVIYRLGLMGHPQTSAWVQVSVGYYAGGSLQVEASRDGAGWVPLSVLDSQHRGGRTGLPGRLFPADEIFIRLKCAGTNASLQVDSFEFESNLKNPPADAEGATHFVEVKQSVPQLEVTVIDIVEPGVDGQWKLECNARNRTGAPLNVSGGLGFDSTPIKPVPARPIPPNASAVFTLSCAQGDPGGHQLSVQFKDDQGRGLFLGNVPVSVSFLTDHRAGHRLSAAPGLRLWWCESGWKVGREQPLPQDGGLAPVTVSAARGEYEPVQIIISPVKDGHLMSARLAPFRNEPGEVALISAEITEVAYVHVTRPTDPSCQPGWYPDPLPRLKTPLHLLAGLNQPLWITFHVPLENKAGEFKSELMLVTTAGTVSVPIVVHVYDFALPDEPHLRSGIGLSGGEINRYQHLASLADKEAVYEKYLDDFDRHRLSPYSFFDYAPITVSFTGEGTQKQAQVDFSRFDPAAEKWLNQKHFTSFRLPLQGMPSGTYEERSIGKLGGFEQGTPEYARLLREYLGQLEQHLGERGWLDKALAYWFDEPQPKDYDFVVEGMKLLHSAAPRIKRLLTITPDPKLVGNVDIWCGLTYRWTAGEIAKRRAAGDEVWWYICTAPKAPYVTEFIDHPGTELRLWPWQSWQYGVSGILIWNSTYWNSPVAFPEPSRQDPWKDPMSYVSGPGVTPGSSHSWGNGDGRFLYPPRPGTEESHDPCLDGPTDSIRWENLRDGMEDYEYFWLLKQAIRDGITSGVDARLLYQAGQLLAIPAEVSKDLTHFTTDPRTILARRDRAARMIEQLTKIEHH